MKRKKSSGYVEVKDFHTIEKRKICLVGEAGVGKTSLINRYVKNEFSDVYITTIGTKVSKKEIYIDFPEEKVKVKVVLMIWDIMGEKSFRSLLKEAYFDGAKGILAVCDITRKETLGELEEWVESVIKITGKIPIIFLANKSDLEENKAITLDDMTQLAKKYGQYPCYLTSAKTGSGVEQAFKKLAWMIVAPSWEEAISSMKK